MAAAVVDLVEMKDLAVRTARELGAGDVRIGEAFPDDRSRRRMRESFARGDLQTWGFDERYASRSNDPARAVASTLAASSVSLFRTRRPRLRTRAACAAASRTMRGRTTITTACERCSPALPRPWTPPPASRSRQLRATRGRSPSAHSPRVPGSAGWASTPTSFRPSWDRSYFWARSSRRWRSRPTHRCERPAARARAASTSARPARYAATTRSMQRVASPISRSAPTRFRERCERSIGDWIWGCDLCQLACPPTQAAGLHGNVSRDGPLDVETARPSLTGLLRLRSGEFKRRFAQTAMGWRGAAVLRRNAAVALGNALDRSAIPALALSVA